MTEKTISMKAKSVQAILNGDKTLTRRLKKEGEKIIETMSGEVTGFGLAYACKMAGVDFPLNLDFGNHLNNMAIDSERRIKGLKAVNWISFKKFINSFSEKKRKVIFLWLVEQGNLKIDSEFIKDKKNKVKYQVGKVYPIVDENEEPVWYCPKCKEFETENNLEKNLMAGWHMLHCKGVVPKPLRIKVLSIKEEKLMDITNKDAEREAGTGFKFPKIVFFNDFFSCYLTQALKAVNLCEDKSPFTITKNSEKICEEWNPVVWRIEFLVVK